jgi:hypothetical protein
MGGWGQRAKLGISPGAMRGPLSWMWAIRQPGSERTNTIPSRNLPLVSRPIAVVTYRRTRAVKVGPWGVKIASRSRPINQ